MEKKTIVVRKLDYNVFKHRLGKVICGCALAEDSPHVPAVGKVLKKVSLRDESQTLNVTEFSVTHKVGGPCGIGFSFVGIIK